MSFPVGLILDNDTQMFNFVIFFFFLLLLLGKIKNRDTWQSILSGNVYRSTFKSIFLLLPVLQVSISFSSQRKEKE